MNDSFPRIITLLRTERKLTQKQAAGALGISQALLSHYERGIRECGLDFLVHCADFYGVSCDYLLGRSTDRNGAMITVDDIPEPEASAAEDKKFIGSPVPILNKKIVANSLNILFSMLQQAKCKALTSEISAYLMLAVYKMFRIMYFSNPKNTKSFFQINEGMSKALSSASMEVLEGKIAMLASGKDVDQLEGFENPDILTISEESLQKSYPLFAPSLLNLVRAAEVRMGAEPPKKK